MACLRTSLVLGLAGHQLQVPASRALQSLEIKVDNWDTNKGCDTDDRTADMGGATSEAALQTCNTLSNCAQHGPATLVWAARCCEQQAQHGLIDLVDQLACQLDKHTWYVLRKSAVQDGI